jgi:hypothetical protein
MSFNRRRDGLVGDPLIGHRGVGRTLTLGLLTLGRQQRRDLPRVFIQPGLQPVEPELTLPVLVVDEALDPPALG